MGGRERWKGGEGEVEEGEVGDGRWEGLTGKAYDDMYRPHRG